MSAELPTSVHCVDEDDLIVSVDEPWLAFAHRNDVPELTRDSVVGRPLWDFVEGETTQDLYRTVLEAVRSRGTSVRFPFRCDAPDRLRWMEMVIDSLPEGGVAFRSVLHGEASRNSVILLDLRADRSDDVVLLCSLCKKVQCGEEWLETSEALEALRLFEAVRLPRLVHTVCPACHGTVLREIRSSA